MNEISEESKSGHWSGAQKRVEMEMKKKWETEK